MHRRTFLQHLAKLAAAGSVLAALPVSAGRKPPSDDPPFAVLLPPFMDGLIDDPALAYLNTTIPSVFDEHRDLFPMLSRPPQYIVVNTLNETLVQHGGTPVLPELLGEETLTLFEVQYLLVTMRFSSVATPHRGANVDHFGEVVYLKQHPQKGYFTPDYLLLEEMIHSQQDKTVMRHIIESEGHDPAGCLHAQLKGISELGAHFYTDPLAGDVDYVFVMDDGSHAQSAPDALQQIADRVNTDPETVLRALCYDVEAYIALDTVAMSNEEKHLWQMVTTWRYARDAEGNPTDLAPAFMPST